MTRATKTTLNNVHHLAALNLDVLTARHGDFGQTTLAVYRPRTELEDRSTAGLAALGLRSMVRGTHALDATQLALAIEALGGSISLALGADVLGLTATVMSEHAVDARHHLAEYLPRPASPRSRWKSNAACFSKTRAR